MGDPETARQPLRAAASFEAWLLEHSWRLRWSSIWSGWDVVSEHLSTSTSVQGYRLIAFLNFTWRVAHTRNTCHKSYVIVDAWVCESKLRASDSKLFASSTSDRCSTSHRDSFWQLHIKYCGLLGSRFVWSPTTVTASEDPCCHRPRNVGSVQGSNVGLRGDSHDKQI